MFSFLAMIVHSFGCQIINRDNIYNVILFIDASAVLFNKKTHSLIETPYLAIIASDGILINLKINDTFG